MTERANLNFLPKRSRPSVWSDSPTTTSAPGVGRLGYQQPHYYCFGLGIWWRSAVLPLHLWIGSTAPILYCSAILRAQPFESLGSLHSIDSISIHSGSSACAGKFKACGERSVHACPAFL